LTIEFKNGLHFTTTTTIANKNRSKNVKFFPKGFDSGKVMTYRRILLSNNRNGLLQLKHSWAILLCITILKILPYILSRSDVDDNVVNFLGYKVKNLGNYKIITLSPSMKVTLKNRWF
jgi:hypothetical protein